MVPFERSSRREEAERGVWQLTFLTVTNAWKGERLILAHTRRPVAQFMTGGWFWTCNEVAYYGHCEGKTVTSWRSWMFQCLTQQQALNGLKLSPLIISQKGPPFPIVP